MAVVGKYLAGDVIVTADGTQSFVPGGHGYDEFVAAADANGDTIEAYVAPPAPLPDLLPYQFRAMLALSGKQADLDAYIAGLSDPAKTIAQAKLDYSLSFQRDNDLVLAAQSALGLTNDQLDALWEQAAQIA
jgi:hypothetical protein